ncbi:nuclear transport factor 2 family protein [Paenibacillus sp. HW567]|uniref:nuclear transport factor 2 family protein n=1 Tax=Paenibacillus sp. HW567 TaxID=1034769 RepID=UPI00036B7CE1|nr:hypothetical protein [Paenibacillus sp. HW567]
MNAAADYIDGKHFVEHSSTGQDGFTGFKTKLENASKEGQAIKYDKVHYVIGQGNFVLTISEGHIGDTSTSFYDLYRVDNGKIVEHWDTLEKIPAKDQWNNDNGKF